jgi:hypothetical protein
MLDNSSQTRRRKKKTRKNSTDVDLGTRRKKFEVLGIL